MTSADAQIAHDDSNAAQHTASRHTYEMFSFDDYITAQVPSYIEDFMKDQDKYEEVEKVLVSISIIPYKLYIFTLVTTDSVLTIKIH